MPFPVSAGDLGLSLGYVTTQRNPYPPEVRQARDRVLRCVARVALRLSRTPAGNIVAQLDAAVRLIAA